MVGGHFVASGNILIKTINVSCIHSKSGLGPTLNPSAASIEIHLSAPAMSGFGFQSLYKDGVTKGQKLLPGFGLVATSILSPRQACGSQYVVFIAKSVRSYPMCTLVRSG